MSTFASPKAANVMIGHIAELLVRKAQESEPHAFSTFLESIQNLIDGKKNVLHICLSISFGESQITRTIMSDGTILLAGEIHPYPGFSVTEKHVRFGRRLPQSLRSRAKEGFLSGKHLSGLIAITMGDIDLVTGSPEGENPPARCENDNNDDIVLLPLASGKKLWNRVKEDLITKSAA